MRVVPCNDAEATKCSGYVPATHVLGASEEFEDCPGIVYHHFVTEFRPGLYLAECLAVEPVYRDGLILLVSEFKMYSFALAIIKIRDHAVVPHRSHAPSDIVKLLAHAPNVHVDNYGRKWSVIFRVGDKGLHHSTGRLDLDKSLAHLKP